MVEYLNREEPSDEGFAERKETLRDQALSSKRQRVVQDWLKSARDAAAVEVNLLSWLPETKSSLVHLDLLPGRLQFMIHRYLQHGQRGAVINRDPLWSREDRWKRHFQKN